MLFRQKRRLSLSPQEKRGGNQSRKKSPTLGSRKPRELAKSTSTTRSRKLSTLWTEALSRCRKQ